MNRIRIMAPRIRLFSDCGELKEVVCRDCGTVLKTTASPTTCLCPNCGGTRFSIRLDKCCVPDPIKEEDNELEDMLKRCAGKSMSSEEFQKKFSDVSALCRSGYAQQDGGRVSISKDAYITEKIFSKITVTVTKEMDLDPEITEKRESFPDILDALREDVPEKGIILIRKAHNPMRESVFSEEVESSGSPEQWVEDSKIVSDLSVEYGGKSMSIKEFMDMLQERYPDAPDNLLDLLVKEKAIEIEGNQVTILK